ncbi:MAG TPA: tripartite tricarboxylate transporter substrate-binding protein [Burkholderiales bacterium]|nr:tripartite tricarboxylate transporter substrate-binding protein [Burkholderiales bacterium]
MVGFTPGGGPDIIARHLAQELSAAWKQQVIVENRPGAGGSLAAALVARAPADGYTLLSVSSAHAAAPAIYAKLPYDTKELTAVTQTGSSKYVLVVSPALGISSLKQLLQVVKEKPGSFNFSSAGVGSGTHFAAEILKARAAIDVVHVPFKGIPEALSETVTGRVQFFMAPIANAMGPVKDGRLVPLAVSSRERDSLLPQVPTIAEAGVPGFESTLWFGLLTTAAVPREIIEKVSADAGRALASPATRERWQPIGIEPRPSTPAQFDELIRNETKLFSDIARAGNIKAE